MKQKEIDNLINIKTEKDIIELFPKTKIVDKKVSFVFYSINPNVWIKCYYMMKDGTCCRDYTSGDINDIDYNSLSLESIYSGMEVTESYKYIWKYKK